MSCGKWKGAREEGEGEGKGLESAPVVAVVLPYRLPSGELP